MDWGKALGNAGNMLGYMKQLELQDKRQKQADEDRARQVLMQTRQDQEYNRQQAELPQMNELRNLQRDVMKTRLEGQKADMQPVPQPSILGGLAQAFTGQIPDQFTQEPGMTVGDKKAQDRAKKIEMARVKYAIDKAAADRQESDRVAARNFDYSKQLRGLPTYHQSQGGSSGGSRSGGGRVGRQTGPMSTTELSQTVPEWNTATAPFAFPGMEKLSIDYPVPQKQLVAKVHTMKNGSKEYEDPDGNRYPEKELVLFSDQTLENTGLMPVVRQNKRLMALRDENKQKNFKAKKEGKPSRFSKPFDRLPGDDQAKFIAEYERVREAGMTTAPTVREYYLEEKAKAEEGGDTESVNPKKEAVLGRYGVLQD